MKIIFFMNSNEESEQNIKKNLINFIKESRENELFLKLFSQILIHSYGFRSKNKETITCKEKITNFFKLIIKNFAPL